MNTYLDFEKPIESLDSRILELKSLNESNPSDLLVDEIQEIENQINASYEKIFQALLHGKELKFLDTLRDLRHKTILIIL